MLGRPAISSEASTWGGSASKLIHKVAGGSQGLADCGTENVSSSWPRVSLSFSAHGPLSIGLPWDMASGPIQRERSERTTPKEPVFL